GSPRAPIDAGLANASDTSYIYEVLDSHPSFPISQPQSRPVGRKVAAQPLWGVISRSVAGGSIAHPRIGLCRVAGADSTNCSAFCFAGIEYRTGDDGSNAQRLDAGGRRACFELEPSARRWGWRLAPAALGTE